MEEQIRQIEANRYWRELHYRDPLKHTDNKVGFFDSEYARVATLDHELRNWLLEHFVNDQGTAFDCLRYLQGESRTNCDLYMLTGRIGKERHNPANLIDFTKVEAYCTLINTYTGFAVRLIPLYERRQYSIVLMSDCNFEMRQFPGFYGPVPEILSYSQTGSFPTQQWDDYHAMYLVQYWLAYGEAVQASPDHPYKPRTH